MSRRLACFSLLLVAMAAPESSTNAAESGLLGQRLRSTIAQSEVAYSQGTMLLQVGGHMGSLAGKRTIYRSSEATGDDDGIETDNDNDDNKNDDLNLITTRTAPGSSEHKRETRPREQEMRRIVDDVRNSLGIGKSARSMSPHSPHDGKSPDIPVSYEVRRGAGGMGLFTTKPVVKGQKLWKFNPEHHVKIYEEDVPLLRRLLQGKSRNIGLWLTRWTYAWPEYCQNCVLYEMDDGRYTNDAEGLENNEASSSAGDYSVAKTNIPANTEILEDYSLDQVADVPNWWQAFIDED